MAQMYNWGLATYYGRMQQRPIQYNKAQRYQTITINKNLHLIGTKTEFG